jgi:hypothetical protein
MLKDKLRAFFMHLLISGILALISLALVYLVWNPAPLYKATGITKIFLLMLGIDLVLGPLLTFIVYKKGKKTLKFDLFVIGLLQLIALVYGLYHVYEGRPVWIAYNVDRFDLVRVNEIDTRNLAQAKVEYQILSNTGPKYVAAVIPTTNLEKKNQILFDELGSGIAPSQRPELYQPLETVYPNIVKRALPLTQLEQFNNSQLVKQTLEKYPQADSFVPLKANAVDMTVLIDKKSGGKVVAIADLRPWK